MRAPRAFPKRLSNGTPNSAALRRAAGVAAERVRKTGTPYEFAPMSSRERRIVHLALRDQTDLHTESQGEGMRRHLIVYPKNYKTPASRAARRTIP